MTDSLLPPRKKNWTEGKFQVGVFIRTEMGGVIEAVNDAATPGMVAAAERLFQIMASDDDLILGVSGVQTDD